MNETLTPEQTTQYYKEQTNLATPLSPKEWLKTQTMDASKLAPATPITLPTTTPDTTNYQAITNAVPTPEVNPVDTELATAQTKSKTLLDRISTLANDIAGRQAFQMEQETAFNVPTQQREVQELTNQLNQIKTEAQTIPLQVQQESIGRGRTAAGIAPIESARNRENAILAMTVGAQLQAKQGNLALALEQSKRATDMKYGPMEQEIAIQEKQLQLLNDYVLSPLEQRRKEQQELILQEKKDKLATQKAQETDFNKNMLSAQQAGMTNVETQQARQLFNSGRIDEANGIIAKYSQELKTVSEGQTLIDPRTGEVIYSAPKTYKPSTSTGLQVSTQEAISQESDPFIKKLLATAGGKPITDTFAQSLDKGLKVLGQIGSLQQTIGNVKTGPILGAFRGANPWDNNAQIIMAQLNAVVPNLARGVYGEVGVLTDADIANYAKTIPNLKSTEDVKNAVLGITLDLIGRSIKSTLEVNAANGKDVSGFVDIYKNMESTKNAILSNIPGYKGPGGVQIAPEESDIFDSIVNASTAQQTNGFFSDILKGLTGK